jgi:hypothetical protein
VANHYPYIQLRGLAASRPVALLDHPHLEQDLGVSTHTWPAKSRIFSPVSENCGFIIAVASRLQGRCRPIRRSSGPVSLSDSQVSCEALSYFTIMTLVDMFKPPEANFFCYRSSAIINCEHKNKYRQEKMIHTILVTEVAFGGVPAERLASHFLCRGLSKLDLAQAVGNIGHPSKWRLLITSICPRSRCQMEHDRRERSYRTRFHIVNHLNHKG